MPAIKYCIILLKFTNMDEIKIDKKIAPPKGGTGRRRIYPFDKMNVGDSFHISIENRKNNNLNYLRNSLLGSANSWANRHRKDYRFITKIQEAGVRIWRIK